MKKNLLILISVFFCLPIIAQKNQDKYTEEKFQKKKMEYLSKQAGLTPQEAAAFFPLYFELQELKKKNNSLAWAKAKKVNKNPQATEEEYEKSINEFIETEKKNMELEQEYMKKGLQIIPASKIFKVLRAEIKFNRNMLKIMNQPTQE
jgi:hypothetical protein